jgi:hypothetical protein
MEGDVLDVGFTFMSRQALSPTPQRQVPSWMTLRIDVLCHYL